METLVLPAAGHHFYPQQPYVPRFHSSAMPPQIPILAQSENKSKFLSRLGISDQTEEGKRIYSMMKEEAIAGRARVSKSPNSLLPQLINDPNVKPPYSNTQISESAMHRETLNIYRMARPETRAYYERGHYVEGDTEENWIIKWLLWHVFRYRDNRNRGRAMPAWINRPAQINTQPLIQRADSPNSVASSSAGSLTPQILPPMLGGSWPSSAPSLYAPSTPQYLPPLHMPDRMLAGDQNCRSQNYTPTTTRGGQSPGYYDPVRDAQRLNR